MFQRNFHISAKCQLNENQQQIKQLEESKLGEKVALRMAVRAKRLWELWIPSVNHTGVPAELKNTKKSAGLYSTLSIVCFVCQVYSSSFNVCFGNDFLAISVCLHLRPQTRLSEVSHKWKFVLLLSSFSKRECSCLVFMPFQQALRKWKHQLSHPGTETGKQTSILKTQTHEAKQAAQQCLLLTGAIPGHAVDQLWITYGWAVDHLWVSWGSAVDELWMSYGSAMDHLWISCGCWVPEQPLWSAPPSHAMPTSPWSSFTAFPSVLNLVQRNRGRAGTRAPVVAVAL